MSTNERSMMGGEVVVYVDSEPSLEEPAEERSKGGGNTTVAGTAEMGTVLVVHIRGFVLDCKDPLNEEKSPPTDDSTSSGSSGSRPLFPLLRPDDIRRPIPFEDLRDVRVQIGEQDVIPALDLGLSRARVGQVLRVRCTAKFAYGATGRVAASSASTPASATASTSTDDSSGAASSSAVPPNAKLEYVITVAAIQNLQTLGLSLPADGRGTGGDAGYYSELEQRNFILQTLLLRKEVGNRWYHYLDYGRALRSYAKGADKAGTFLEQDRGAGAGCGMDGDTPATPLPLRQIGKSLVDTYTTVLNNMAACHIHMADLLKAKEVCIHILRIDGNNIKALLRAAKVSLGLHNFDECEACVAKVLSLEPGNALATAERARLAKARKDYKVSSKELAQRMFMTKTKDKEKDKEKEKEKEKSKQQGQGQGQGSPARGRTLDSGGSGEWASADKAVAAAAAAAPKGEGEDKSGGKLGYSGDSNMLLLLVTAALVLCAAICIAHWDIPVPIRSALQHARVLR